jgi:hypothetical protein
MTQKDSADGEHLKEMVTRARFERATPSFGGCSGNPVTYRCFFAIRKTWFGPVVP